MADHNLSIPSLEESDDNKASCSLFSELIPNGNDDLQGSPNRFKKSHNYTLEDSSMSLQSYSQTVQDYDESIISPAVTPLRDNRGQKVDDNDTQLGEASPSDKQNAPESSNEALIPTTVVVAAKENEVLDQENDAAASGTELVTTQAPVDSEGNVDIQITEGQSNALLTELSEGQTDKVENVFNQPTEEVEAASEEPQITEHFEQQDDALPTQQNEGQVEQEEEAKVEAQEVVPTQENQVDAVVSAPAVVDGSQQDGEREENQEAPAAQQVQEEEASNPAVQNNQGQEAEGDHQVVNSVQDEQVVENQEGNEDQGEVVSSQQSSHVVEDTSNEGQDLQQNNDDSNVHHEEQAEQESQEEPNAVLNDQEGETHAQEQVAESEVVPSEEVVAIVHSEQVAPSEESKVGEEENQQVVHQVVEESTEQELPPVEGDAGAADVAAAAAVSGEAEIVESVEQVQEPAEYVEEVASSVQEEQTEVEVKESPVEIVERSPEPAVEAEEIEAENPREENQVESAPEKVVDDDHVLPVEQVQPTQLQEEEVVERPSIDDQAPVEHESTEPFVAQNEQEQENAPAAVVEVAEELPEESRELSAPTEEVVEVVEVNDGDAVVVAERTEEAVETAPEEVVISETVEPEAVPTVVDSAAVAAAADATVAPSVHVEEEEVESTEVAAVVAHESEVSEIVAPKEEEAEESSASEVVVPIEVAAVVAPAEDAEEFSPREVVVVVPTEVAAVVVPTEVHEEVAPVEDAPVVQAEPAQEREEEEVAAVEQIESAVEREVEVEAEAVQEQSEPSEIVQSSEVVHAEHVEEPVLISEVTKAAVLESEQEENVEIPVVQAEEVAEVVLVVAATEEQVVQEEEEESKEENNLNPETTADAHESATTTQQEELEEPQTTEVAEQEEPQSTEGIVEKLSNNQEVVELLPEEVVQEPQTEQNEEADSTSGAARQSVQEEVEQEPAESQSAPISETNESQSQQQQQPSEQVEEVSPRVVVVQQGNDDSEYEIVQQVPVDQVEEQQAQLPVETTVVVEAEPAAEHVDEESVREQPESQVSPVVEDEEPVLEVVESENQAAPTNEVVEEQQAEESQVEQATQVEVNTVVEQENPTFVEAAVPDQLSSRIEEDDQGVDESAFTAQLEVDEPEQLSARSNQQEVTASVTVEDAAAAPSEQLEDTNENVAGAQDEQVIEDSEEFNQEPEFVASSTVHVEQVKESNYIPVSELEQDEEEGDAGQDLGEQESSQQEQEARQDNQEEDIVALRARLESRQEGLALREMQLDAVEKQLEQASEQIEMQAQELRTKLREAEAVKEQVSDLENKENALKLREEKLAVQVEFLKEQDLFIQSKEDAVAEREAAVEAKEKEVECLREEAQKAFGESAQSNQESSGKEQALQEEINALNVRLEQLVSEENQRQANHAEVVEELNQQLQSQQLRVELEQGERVRIEDELTRVQAELHTALSQQQAKEQEESQMNSNQESSNSAELVRQMDSLVQLNQQLESALATQSAKVSSQEATIQKLEFQIEDALKRNSSEKVALESKFESLLRENAEEIRRLKLANEEAAQAGESNLRGESSRKGSLTSITSSGRKGIPQTHVENSNYETIITDLRDTINMLNQKCDDYEIQIENYQKQNNQLISSFKEIRSSIGQNQVSGLIDRICSLMIDYISAWESKGLEEEVETQKIKVKQLLKRLEESEKTREIDSKQAARAKGELDFYLMENKKLSLQIDDAYGELRELKNVLQDQNVTMESIHNSKESVISQNELLLRDIQALQDQVASTKLQLAVQADQIAQERLARDLRFEEQLLEWNAQRQAFEDQTNALAADYHQKALEFELYRKQVELERQEGEHVTRQNLDNLQVESLRRVELVREQLGQAEAEKLELLNRLARQTGDLDSRLTQSRDENLMLREKSALELQQAKNDLTVFKFQTDKQISDLNNFIAQQKLAMQEQLQEAVTQQNQDAHLIDQLHRENLIKDSTIEQLSKEVKQLADEKQIVISDLLNERELAKEELEKKLIEFSVQLDSASNQTKHEANLAASRVSARYEVEVESLKEQLLKTKSKCENQEISLADNAATIESLQLLVIAKKQEIEKIQIEVESFKSAQNHQNASASQEFATRTAALQKELDKVRVDKNEAEHACRELQTEVERQVHTNAQLESRLDATQQALHELQAKSQNTQREYQQILEQTEHEFNTTKDLQLQAISQKDQLIDALTENEQKLSDDNSNLRGANEGLYQIKRELEGQVAHAAEESRVARAEARRLEEVLKRSQLELEDTRSQFLLQNSELSNKNGDLNQILQDLSDLENEKNALLEENNRLRSADEEAVQLRQQVGDLELQLSELFAAQTSVVQKLQLSEKQEKASRDLSIQVRDVLQKTEGELKLLQEENDQLQNLLSNKSSSVTEEQLKLIRQYENLQKEHANLITEKDQVVSDNQELTKMIEDFQQDQSGASAAAAQLQTAEAYIEDQSHQLRLLQAELNASSAKINQLQESNAQIEKLYVAVKEKEKQDQSERNRLVVEIEESKKRSQNDIESVNKLQAGEVERIKQLLIEKQMENDTLREELQAIKPQESSVRTQLLEKDSQLQQMNTYINEQARSQQTKDAEIESLRDLLIEKNALLEDHAGSIRHLNDELVHFKATFHDQLDHSISDSLHSKNQQLQDHQALVQKYSDETAELHRIVQSQREQLLRAQTREADLERELQRRLISEEVNHKARDQSTDKELKLLKEIDDLKATNQVIQSNLDRTIKEREEISNNNSGLMDAHKPAGMKGSLLLPPRIQPAINSARAQKEAAVLQHPHMMASPVQMRQEPQEEVVKKAQPLTNSYLRSSPMGASSTVSVTNSGYNPQSTAVLDQAYLKCIQRSRNLLSKNETILNSLKQSNSSVERSIRNPSPSSSITVQPILNNNHNHLLSSGYRGSSQGFQQKKSVEHLQSQVNQQRPPYLNNPPVPANLSNPSTLLNNSGYAQHQQVPTQSRSMNTSMTQQQKRPPVMESRNRTFSIDQSGNQEFSKSDLLSHNMSNAMLNGSYQQANNSGMSNSQLQSQQNKPQQYQQQQPQQQQVPRARSNSTINQATSSSSQDLARYEGERLGNLRHGRGRSFYASGELYEGEWKSDKRHGYGILKDSSGEIYNGDWEFDQYHGQGRLRNKNGEVLTQEFDFKNFENLRNFWFSYSGEFKNNSFNGLGTLILSNGEKFLGSFAGGKVHGEGTFYRLSGDIEVGHWQNNKYLGKL